MAKLLAKKNDYEINTNQVMYMGLPKWKGFSSNGSNPDGSFTMDESNTFSSPQGFPPNTIYG